MKITNLVENTSGVSACRPEHGLSFYIETSAHKILMDTGASDLITENASKLNISLKEIDTVVISHGHYDHGGGLPAFLNVNDTAKVYLHEKAFGEYYSVDDGVKPRYIGLLPELKNNKQIIPVSGLHKIDRELELFSDIPCIEPVPSTNISLKKKTKDGFVQDDFLHEQCLVINEGGKSILFSGCAHHGIINIMEKYRVLYGADPDAVISGFHLMKNIKKNNNHSEISLEEKKQENITDSEYLSESTKQTDMKTCEYSSEDIMEIQSIAKKLKRYQSKFYTCHCTGERPYEVMKEIMGEQLCYVHCGDVIFLK